MSVGGKASFGLMIKSQSFSEPMPLHFRSVSWPQLPCQPLGGTG